MASSNPAPTDTITTTTPAGAAEQMMPITIVHLVVIVICVLLTIAMIWWGNRLWQRRRAGQRNLSERNETVEVGDAPVETARSHDLPATPPEPPRKVERPAPVAEPVVPPQPTREPEPPAPVAEPVVTPPVETASPPATSAAAAPPPLTDVLPSTPPTAPVNDLTTLKGLGPKAAALLAERKVLSVADLAALSPDEAAALDADLGPFRGRMARDRWHEQAQLLTSGDRAGYEAIFGKLG